MGEPNFGISIYSHLLIFLNLLVMNNFTPIANLTPLTDSDLANIFGGSDVVIDPATILDPVALIVEDLPGM